MQRVIVVLFVTLLASCQQAWQSQPVYIGRSGQKMCAKHHVPLVKAQAFQPPASVSEGSRSVAIYLEPTLETVEVARRSPNCVPLGVSRKRSRYVSEPIEIYYCPFCQKEVEEYWHKGSSQPL